MVVFLNNQTCLNVDVRKATTKYKHTKTAFKESSKKSWKKSFNSIDAKELQELQKVLVIWVKI